MHSIGCLLALSLVVLVCRCQHMSFENFTILYDKHYAGEQEYYYRKGVYESNLIQIDEANAKNLSYTSGVTPFSDRTPAEFIANLGLLPDDDAPIDQFDDTVLPKIGASATGFEAGVNWNLTSYVSTPQDQGTCSCCWAFTAAAATQTQYFMQTGQKTVLSKQFFVSCTQSSDCRGGYQKYATIKALTGVPLETAYPYVSAHAGTITPTVPGICLAASKVQLATGTTYKHYRRLSHSQMRALLKNGPVMATFATSYPFMQYKGGVFMCNTTTLSQINHAVTVIGYTDINGTSGGDWIIKNSWGSGWGEGGFGTISKYRDCSLKYDVYQFVNPNTTNSTVAAKWEYTVDCLKLLVFAAVILIA